MRESEAHTLPNGRILSYAVYGSPVPKTTVFYFHAFPSSRKEGKLWHTAASKLHIRLIAPDRPGMGNSSPQANRTLLDWPKDVIALADHLKVERFYIMGLSGGGPYALACVKEIPKERLAGVSVVSGLYPIAFGTAGMMLLARVVLWVGPYMTGLLGGIMDMAMGKAARDPDPKVLEDQIMKDIESRPAVDQAAMKDDKNKEAFIEGTREGLRQGGQGAAWEARLSGSPWGFELQELDVGEGGIPLALWHGTGDINCPPAMAIKAKEIMLQATLHMKEGEGHVSYAFRNQEEILGELIGASDS
ncbi:alpha/beta hydrolase fold domain-containing protein [Byssothecium circinans]|uniref:Alpha/beta hydrolase fold domain-containing protein n=1 Tax=Byssothecium circinans TaxID=147558 RepID=A0A6A5U9S3_9PLEO|nr:alpha/beta hydrolase fold domain-containing protein [Byssothecium circinans]